MEFEAICGRMGLVGLKSGGITYLESELVAQSCLFATPWTVAHQAPLSMGFSRQECWSGLSCLFSRDLPEPGIKPSSPTLQPDSLLFELLGKPNLS